MSSGKSKDKKGSVKKDQDQWVMLLPDAAIQTAHDEPPTLCQLRHPRTDQGAMFLFTPENKQMFEVLRFQEKHRSWFIEDSVQSDGSMVLPTPIDPVFLTLPYLMKSSQSGKFMQLEQIIEDADYPECNRIFSCEAVKHVDQVCEFKGADDYKVYRYSEEKTLKWLKAKVTKLVEVLKERKVPTSHTGSHTSTYITSSKSTTSSNSDLLRFAHGLISEYLPVDLGKTLQNFLGIEDMVHEKPMLDEPKAKRRKSDVAPTTDYSLQQNQKEDKSKAARPTLKQKQLEKVDKSGMKSISSFFSPKSKK